MKIIADKVNITEKAGKALNDIIKNRNSKPLLMLLSGGSSLKLLDYVEDDAFSPDVTLGMLDDRYSTDPTVNSFGIIQDSSFVKKAKAKGSTFLDSSVHEKESLEQYGLRYEKYIRAWMFQHPDGIIRATVGIGPDGHTSGVLPHPEAPEKFDALFNSERLVIGYDVGDKNPHRYRMTSTFTLMRKFDAVLTFMTGENKKDALKKVLADEGTLPETPGRIAKELKDVEIYTDIAL